MHKTKWVVYIFMFALIAIVVWSCSKEEVLEIPFETSIENEIMELINQHRVSVGLGELKANALMNEEARIHSYNMSTGAVPFGHDGFEDRVETIQSQLGGYIFAENVAKDYANAQIAVTAWLNSDGHKKNIEGDYNLSGIGVVLGDDGMLYFTQLFIAN